MLEDEFGLQMMQQNVTGAGGRRWLVFGRTDVTERSNLVLVQTKCIALKRWWVELTW